MSFCDKEKFNYLQNAKRDKQRAKIFLKLQHDCSFIEAKEIEARELDLGGVGISGGSSPEGDR